MSNRNRVKKAPNEINDGITRDFVYPSLALDAIDTPEVQRLHGIVQNGFSSTSYPNLTHTRKAHTMGVIKNALLMLDSAVRNSSGYLDSRERADDKDKSAVVLAAAFHDIGHGAYSHDLEGILNGSTGRSHEQVSSDMITGNFSLRQFYEEMPEEVISPNLKRSRLRTLKELDDVRTVIDREGIPSDLIAQIVDDSTEQIHPRLKEKPYLREIINGDLIDADKFDYLQRDAMNAGISETAFDPKGLTDSLAIVEYEGRQHLGVSEQGVEFIVQMLNHRAFMYSRVYTHKTTLRKQAMVNDAVRRFLGSLDDEQKEQLGQSLYLLDDGMFEALVSTHENADPVALDLLSTAKYDRRGYHKIAYSMGTQTILAPFMHDSTIESVTSGNLETLKKLYEIKNEDGGVDDLRKEIYNEVVKKHKTLDDHNLIVYFPYPGKYRDRNALLDKKFNLHIYNDKGDVYTARDAMQGKVENHEVLELFNAFGRHQTSSYFMVLASDNSSDGHLVKTVREATQDILVNL